MSDEARTSRLGSVRRKMALVTTLITLVIGSSLALYYIEDETQQRLNEARNSARDLLQTISGPCAMALALGELERLDGILGELVRPRKLYDKDDEDNTTIRDIELVEMLDHDGRRFAHTGSGASEPGVGRWSASRELDLELANAASHSNRPRWWQYEGAEGRELLVVSMPAVAGLRWGTLLARINLSSVYDDIERQRRSLVLAILILGLLLFVVIQVTVNLNVLRPVEELSRVARAMSSGDLAARSSIWTKDEFGQLAQTFNTMADELQYNTELLESKVRHRTTALQEANEKLAEAVDDLERLARTDQLTGLMNRRALDESLAFELRRSTRTNSPLGLLLLDLDHFKQVNDCYGHPTGDRVLADFAMLLRSRLRGIDILGRLGGEEFAVLLLDTNLDSALSVAQSLGEAVRSYPFMDVEGEPIDSVTVSSGIAIFPDDANDTQTLVARADEALYEAKRTGRDRVVAWSTRSKST